MTQFILVRRPSTMEDAGRAELVGTYGTWGEADDARDSYVKRSKGYYHASELVVLDLNAEAQPVSDEAQPEWIETQHALRRARESLLDKIEKSLTKEHPDIVIRPGPIPSSLTFVHPELGEFTIQVHKRRGR